jgi:predicted ATP-grasp superfamily ATP-dependent carboligase
MSGHPQALLLGIDTPIGVTILRELGVHGVPVHGVGRSANAVGRASRYCTGFSLRPAGRPDDWLPGLITQTGAKALFAVSEDDLVALAQLPPVINGCAILTPRAQPLAIVLDKNATLARATATGIDVPISWQPLAGEDMKVRARTLAYPVVAKWADPPAMTDRLVALGLPLIKAEYLHNADQLVALISRYAPLGAWPLIQSYCPGFGLGQMIHMAGGKAVLRFQHRRLHEMPPEGGVSTLCASEPLGLHAAQMAKSEALLANIGWDGPAMVEYRYNPANGCYALMEINGRFWGSIPLASHSGVKFGWESYRRAILGQTDSVQPPIKPRYARYMIPETRRLIQLLFRRKPVPDPFFKATLLADLVSYLTGFFNPRMRYYLFQWSDPGPFLSDIKTVFMKAVRRGKP